MDEEATVAARQDHAPEPLGPPSVRGLWALGFVALSLVLLVGVPAYYGRQVAAAERLIVDVYEPAARLSSNVSLLKARQMARMEGYLATEDRAFRDPYNGALADEDSVLAELQVLTREVDAGCGERAGRIACAALFERVARLITESNDWRFLNQRIFDLGVAEGDRDRVLAGYNDLQRATRELDLAILAEVDQGRRLVAIEQSRQSRITLGLALLALLATLLVARVAYRYRALTIEGERRRREAVQARREIDALLEATGDGVLGVDLDGRCTSLNRAGVELLGYTEREMIGRDIHKTIMHSWPDGSPAPREDSEVLVAIAEGRRLESSENAVLWRRRSISFPAHWSLQPMIDGTDLVGAVLTFTDMTEIHERRGALRRAIQQREDVVSIVSHDLRNPLGVVLAAADLLLDLPLDEEKRRRQAQIIHRSGKRMQHLIEDLLDVARIEAGALVVRLSREELMPILEEAQSLFREQAAARSVALTVEPPSGQYWARVDRDRIIQALSNLLDNAIRLTPAGGRVTLSVVADGDDVLVSVADTGPGIAPELHEGLFDRFAQLEGREGGGAGLGLAIVHGVATAHAGEVTVASRTGQGSVFTLRLPRQGPAVGEEAPSEARA